MSKKASTAALDRCGQRLLLPRRRVSSHPASGQLPYEKNGMQLDLVKNPRLELE
jgi:hypothetical protein